jgi:hypothetical protein
MSQNPDIQLSQFKEKSVNPTINNDLCVEDYENEVVNDEQDFGFLTRETSTIYQVFQNKVKMS